MKLILKEYLSSLRERDELDAILPDLLSQLGLNVYSRPARGTRQDGVDVGAVGRLNGGAEKVYLFSIKPGDLTRRDWSSESPQSLRPSLNQILDSYIPNRLPVEHRDKDIVICVAIGGDVQEQLRPDLTGYFTQNARQKITFEEWNGDKLAELIQSSFLREDLLPEQARSLLRKSLAMLDEPEVSYKHFSELIRAFSTTESDSDAKRLTSIRQMSICLWILFAWSRNAENTESAYLSGEFTLLHGWNIVRHYAGKKNKTSIAMETAFLSIFSAYHQICHEFLNKNVLPYANKLHAVSSAVRGSCSLDINLKLFDLLGRLGLDGIWAYWGALRCAEEDGEQKETHLREAYMRAEATKALIFNNPALLLPAKDDQAIDIVIAASLFATIGRNREFISSWLSEMLKRATFSYEANGRYPCVLHSYIDLLEHPQSTESEYKERATCASILYPYIALWSSLLNDADTYDKVSAFKKDLLQHCTFQFWYPDDRSESNFYTNSDHHGAALPNLAIDRSKDEFLSQVFGECDQSPHFKELSAVKFGWWPLIIIACRHYRLPLPLHLLERLRTQPSAADDAELPT